MVWFSKFKEKLKSTISPSKTAEKNAILDDLEELFIKTDFGVNFTSYVLKEISKQNFKTKDDILLFIKKYLTEILNINKVDLFKKPSTLLFFGVNGAGKTTSIGKIAYSLRKDKVLIAAGDTFRASATEQLEVWAKSSSSDIMKDIKNPSALIYQSCLKAKNYDFLLIDTAGRFPNKTNLMEELKKINDIVNKLRQNSFNLLVIDGTTGQNLLVQIEAFKKIINIDGLIITKLDGTAKAGIIIPTIQKYQIPIYFLGIGEKANDLKEFIAKDFVNELFSL